MSTFVEFARDESLILQVVEQDVESSHGNIFKVRSPWMDSQDNTNVSKTIEGTEFHAREGVLTFKNPPPLYAYIDNIKFDNDEVVLYNYCNLWEDKHVHVLSVESVPEQGDVPYSLYRVVVTWDPQMMLELIMGKGVCEKGEHFVAKMDNRKFYEMLCVTNIEDKKILTTEISGEVYVDEYVGKGIFRVREVWRTNLKYTYGMSNLQRVIRWYETPVAGETAVFDNETFYSRTYIVKFRQDPLLYTYMDNLEFEHGEIKHYIPCRHYEGACLRLIDISKREDMYGTDLQLYTFMMEDFNGSRIIQFVRCDSEETYNLFNYYSHDNNEFGRVVLEFGEDIRLKSYRLINISNITYILSMRVTEGEYIGDPTLDAFAALLERPSATKIQAFKEKLENYKSGDKSEAYGDGLKTLSEQINIISSWVPLTEEEKVEKKKWKRVWIKRWKKTYNRYKIFGNESYEEFLRVYTDLIHPDICKQIRSGNMCNTVQYVDRAGESLGLTDERWHLQYEISELVNAFRMWYVHRATHVFRLYDYNNYFLTTQELGSMYYMLPVKYRGVLVWEYKLTNMDHVISVLANGDRLGLGGE